MKRDFQTPFVVCLLAISGNLPIFSASKQTSVSLAACKVRHAYTLPRVHTTTHIRTYTWRQSELYTSVRRPITRPQASAYAILSTQRVVHASKFCAVRRSRCEPHLPTAAAVSLSPFPPPPPCGCVSRSYPTLSLLALLLPRTRLQATSIKMRAIRYNLIGYAGRVNSSDDAR